MIDNGQGLLVQILASVDNRNDIHLAICGLCLSMFVIYASCLHDAKKERKRVMLHKFGVKEI